MKAYKITILVLDFDDMGEENVRKTIEETRYANHCISPEVKSIQSCDIEWADDHPLNNHSTSDAEYARLFS